MDKKILSAFALFLRLGFFVVFANLNYGVLVFGSKLFAWLYAMSRIIIYI
jgi:hypothetical protein